MGDAVLTIQIMHESLKLVPCRIIPVQAPAIGSDPDHPQVIFKQAGNGIVAQGSRITCLIPVFLKLIAVVTV
jgi:hypothetical protein